MSAENALELLRFGRLTRREGAEYEVVRQSSHYDLRRYRSRSFGMQTGPPLLLVPPLMMTAEIYDVAPENSAVEMLVAGGIDTWVVDFGAPETIEGGMSRTLDDHVRAVADAIAYVHQSSSRNVHLAGYSQGGMFAYQAAAYRRSQGIASVITFGSPVDIHGNIPSVSHQLTGRLMRAWRPVVEPILARLPGLPGALTSTGFKLFSIRKEVAQLIEFLSLLHDRRALEKREARRRFLAGEGFVAWPGPALVKFIDEFVVHNRLLSGGFVIDGRTVTLADIRCPVLLFVGARDDIARPAAVRAAHRAVVSAEVSEITLPAGHFGLVVGSLAMRETWPTVVEWIRFREGLGQRPRLLPPAGLAEESAVVEDMAFSAPLDFELFYDTILRTTQSGLRWLNDAIEDAGDVADQLRYQLPRLLRLRQLEDAARISIGLELSAQAGTAGARTYFLYKGRAVTYAAVNARVDAVVRGLIECGVRPRNYVGVLMSARPSFLSLVCALNRLGAIAVVIKPDEEASLLRHAVSLGHVQFLCTDPENSSLARDAFTGDVLVLGGAGSQRIVAQGTIDMEAIDPATVELPDWYDENPGRAEDLALVLVYAGLAGVRTARITNRRWAVSALGAAAACTLTPNDTVYCCLPLHHPAGLLVSVGGASVSGARLALATRFEPDVFWDEVRRYGATVVFYANEMCRQIVDAPVVAGERNHPLRLFAGSGMREDVWHKLTHRFGVGVLEFYASTEVSAVLANAAGTKIGSLGRPLPGSREVFLAAYDLQAGDFVRDARGHIQPAQPNHPGVLLARIERTPLSPLDDHARRPSDPPSYAHEQRILRNVRHAGDCWFATWDILRQEQDDFWYVDNVGEIVTTAHGALLPRAVEALAYEITGVELAAAYGLKCHAQMLGILAVMLRPGHSLHSGELEASLLIRGSEGTQAPDYVRVVEHISMTDGFRPEKQQLRAQHLEDCIELFRLDTTRTEYVAQNRPVRGLT